MEEQKMMTKTFKEQVEEILCSHCGFKINNGFADRVDCESAKKLKECSTDRILSAHNAELDRIAEGMLNSLHWPSDTTDMFYQDIEVAKARCQAYIQAQKGSKVYFSQW